MGFEAGELREGGGESAGRETEPERAESAICFVKEAGETTSGSRDRLCQGRLCLSAICFMKEAGGTA